MVKTVHVVPHTHWDREWFFTTSRAQIYLLKDLKDVINNLENNVGFNHFILFDRRLFKMASTRFKESAESC